MASPVVQSVGAQVISTTAPLSVPIPGTTANGDLILITEGIANAGDRTGVSSGGLSGSFVQFIEDIATRGSWSIDWKFITGSEGAGNYSTPGDNGSQMGAQALAISGADPTNPIWPTVSLNDATTSDTADVQLNGLPECLLIYGWRSQGAGSNVSFATPPDVGGTQMTRRTTAASQNFHLFTLPFAGGNTGVVDGLSGGSATHRCILFAVVPPSTGLPTRVKERGGSIITPSGVRIKDRAGSLITPSGARYKDRAGNVTTLF